MKISYALYENQILNEHPDEHSQVLKPEFFFTTVYSKPAWKINYFRRGWGQGNINPER